MEPELLPEPAIQATPRLKNREKIALAVLVVAMLYLLGMAMDTTAGPSIGPCGHPDIACSGPDGSLPDEPVFQAESYDVPAASQFPFWSLVWGTWGLTALGLVVASTKRLPEEITRTRVAVVGSLVTIALAASIVVVQPKSEYELFCEVNDCIFDENGNLNE